MFDVYSETLAFQFLGSNLLGLSGRLQGTRFGVERFGVTWARGLGLWVSRFLGFWEFGFRVQGSWVVASRSAIPTRFRLQEHSPRVEQGNIPWGLHN